MSAPSARALPRLPWIDRSGRLSPLRAVTFGALLLPAVSMTADTLSGKFWPSSVVPLIYWSGVWATIVLLLALAVTPARRIFRINSLIGVRRMIGLAALAYTVGHMLAYFFLKGFDAGLIFFEMTSRPTLVVATASFAGLVILAATSTDGWVQRLGAVRWNTIHRAVYIFAFLAILHFLMSPGAAGGLPFVMAGAFVWLMVWRLLDRRRLGANPVALLALGVGTALFTLVFEAVWAAGIHGLDPWVTLGFNFSLILGVSAAWQMLFLGLAVTLAAMIFGQRPAGEVSGARGGRSSRSLPTPPGA